MIFNPQKYSSGDFYKLMIQAIIPRPIAWVLSVNPNGSFNVAPFSFFNGVASEPPLFMIGIGRKDDDSRKDTWVNIDERKNFVVHIPSADMAQPMVNTSKALPFGESELALDRLETVEVEGWALPRLRGPRVAMLSEKHKIYEVGSERSGMILGEIKQIWVDDSVMSENHGRLTLDPKKIDPVTRLGGLSYGFLGAVKELPRPK